MNDVKHYMREVARLTDETIESLLPPESTYPSSIHAVMRYSLFAGGKRIRPALLMASFESCGGEFGEPNVRLACAAFEMFHTFSLMHDDLPCMDDDDLRRGKPTAHKAFGEAVAVLGGDALCIFAFECLARMGRLDVIQETARALGTQGMIGGQVVDIESEGKSVDRSVVDYIHHNKTAALITASVRTGALLAHAPVETLAGLTSYGTHVGLAFQVVDDILDEEGSTEQLGKDSGSDRQRGKATYPSACGMEESKHYAQELIEQSWNDITFLGDKAAMLRQLAEYIRTRIS
jgi:geranylgeranyl diphosphate synthase type II